MTLQELRYLVALADTGHFAKAAELCHISQSTLSAQIKKLEDYLGATLFDRDRRCVAPSPIAQEVVAAARRMIAEAEHIRRVAREAVDPMVGALRLGVIPTLGPYFFPRVLEALHGAYPQLRLLLMERMTPVLTAQLTSGELDAGLLALPLPGDAWCCEALFDEPFLLAAPANHRLARQRPLDPATLGAEGLLLLEEGHCLREQALALCGETRGEQGEEIRGTSLEMLRQMVAQGIGYSIFPVLATEDPQASRRSDRRVVYRRFDRPLARRIGLVWRRRGSREAALRRLAETLRALAPPEVEVVRAAE